MTKKLPITTFFSDVLNAPFKNRVWSWGSETEEAIYLRVWSDELLDGNRVGILKVNETGTIDKTSSAKLGWLERQRHVEAMKSGKAAYGVLLKHKVDEYGNKKHGRGSIADYNDVTVFPLVDMKTESGHTTVMVELTKPRVVR